MMLTASIMCRESAGVSTRASASAMPSSFAAASGVDNASSGRMTMQSTRNTPRSMSSGALVDVRPRCTTSLIRGLSAASFFTCLRLAQNAQCRVHRCDTCRPSRLSTPVRPETYL